MSTEFKNAYAVIVGMSEYLINSEDLQPMPEITEQARTLTKSLVHLGLGAYNPANVLLLTGAQATKANILQAFTWLENKLAEDDSEQATAVVYMAGQHLRTGTTTHLIPFDVAELGQLSGKVLSDSLISRKLNSLGFPNSLLILDTWQTGLILGSLREKGINPPVEDPDQSSDPRNPNSNPGDGEIPLTNHVFINHVYSEASEDGSTSSTVFAHTLAEAITGHASPSNGDTEVDVHDMVAYLFQQIPEGSEDKTTLSADFYGSSFSIANLLGGNAWETSSNALSVDNIPDLTSNILSPIEAGAATVIADAEAANFREDFSTRVPENENQKALWALMIGIDEYPIPTHKLGGCVNDMYAFHDYLEEYCNREADPDNESLVFIPKTLVDEQATKAAIIEQFQKHFKENARDGDVCLLYYSGHGASIKAAPEFWDEHDGRHETMVCYDSRIANGKDLIDKELSFLIWDATKDKDVHFVTIMDSCYSGSGTKLPDEEIRLRQVEGRDDTQYIDYHGRESYESETRDGRIRLTPPRGRHVNLAAAKSSETAKEMRIDGESRGVFTYELISTLRAYGNQLSYSELINNVNARVGSRVEKQSPQLDTVVLERNEDLANGLFLNGAIQPVPDTFIISFDQDRAGANQAHKWVLDAGAIQGVVLGKSQFRLVDENGNPLEDADGNIIVADINIHQVAGNHTVLDVDETNSLWSDSSKTYHAVMARTRTKLAFSADSDNAAKATLQEALNSDSRLILEITEDASLAQYIIYAENNRYSLHKADSLRPIFDAPEGFNLSNAGKLLRSTHKLAQWSHVLAINNETSNIKEKDLEIDLSKLIENTSFSVVDAPYGNDNPIDYYYTYQADGSWVKNTDKLDNTFRYRRNGNNWEVPKFQVKLTNKSQRPYFVSAPYLGYEYSITNQFLQKAELLVGNDPIELTFSNESSIELFIIDADNANGRTEGTEYVKVFISTDEIDTDIYNQDGIGTDVIQRPARVEVKHDWVTRIIPIRIVLPFDVEQRNFNGISVNGLPATVKTLLISPNEPNRLFGWLPPEQLGEDKLEGFELKPGIGEVPGLSVVELFDTEGNDFGGAENPVALTLNPAPDTDVLAFGYDPEVGEFVFLGQTDDAGVIQIAQLPVATPCGTPGIENSVKIFLRKIV